MLQFSKECMQDDAMCFGINALDRLTNPIRRWGAIIITNQCIVSFRIVSVSYIVYRIVSHRIRIVSASYRIVSRASAPYRVLSHRIVIVSHRVVSYRYCYRIASHRVVIVSYSYRIRIVSVSSHEPAYRIASCLIATVIVSYPYRIRSIVSRTIVSHRIVSYRVVSYRTVSYHAVSYRYRYRIVSVSSHDPLYRIVSYRIVSSRLHVSTSPRLHVSK